MPRNLELQNAQVFGQVEYKGGVQFMAAAGAIDPNCAITEVVSLGAIALTLAAPTDGHQVEKYIYFKTDGGDVTITPAALLGYTTITLNTEGDAVKLLYVPAVAKWVVVSNQGAALA